MRSFTIMTALMAAGSLAQPLNEKRAVEYVTETEVTYETVWIDPSAAAPTPIPEAQAAAAAPVPSPAVHGHAAAHQAAPAVSTPEAVAVPAPSSTAEVAAPSVKIAPAANVAMSGGNGVNSFEKTCVNSHNAIRAQHNVGKLTWDDKLAASAQALAATCVFEHNVQLGPASGYGQNIAMSYGTLGMHSKIAEVKSVIVDSWYTGEAAKFSQLGLYGKANPLDSDFDAWGHFSQEVWKGTTKVGCAVAPCTAPDKNGYFTVCNYDPAGNYADEFASNVFH